MYSLGVGTQLSLGSDESNLVRVIRELSNDGGWTGSIRTLTIDAKVRLVLNTFVVELFSCGCR